MQQSVGELPDTEAVVVHFDVDCFYAQCEELRDPRLRALPMAVTQKYLIVTCNYPARACGVTKLMNIAEAQRRCPPLHLVSGEDLSPYRAASKQLVTVLQRYGTAERLGLDEVWVDVTAEVDRRISSQGIVGPDLLVWRGHVLAPGAALVQDSKHRPMDLRAARACDGARGCTAPGDTAAEEQASASQPASWEVRLRVGSAIAEEARAAVKAEAGLRTSAGIASNRLLSKLISGIHKPDQQTILQPPHAAGFVAPLPLRALPGIGAKLEADLAAAGCTVVEHLRSFKRGELVHKFGERLATFLFLASRGKDPTPVQEHGPPASITVEDSFKACRGHAAAARVLSVLAPDLAVRLREELEDSGRRAATLVVKWRHRGQGWSRHSAQCAMPQAALALQQRSDADVAAALVAAAAELLARHVSEPDLTLLSLGATKFDAVRSGGGGSAPPAGRSILDMMRRGGGDSSGPSSVLTPSVPVGCGGVLAAAPLASPLPATAASAARSAQQRRDYGPGKDGVAVMSKRAERQLREQHPSSPLPGTAASCGWERGGRPRPEEQGQLDDDGGGAMEDDSSGLWGDLAGLADWRVDRPVSSAVGGGRVGGSGQGTEVGGMAGPQPQAEDPQRTTAAPRATGATEAAAPRPAVQRTVAASCKGSYRNAEALALQEMFGVGEGSCMIAATATGALAAAADEEEEASMQLALKLQKEEVEPAAAGRASHVGSRKRKGSGPLDAFLLRQRK